MKKSWGKNFLPQLFYAAVGSDDSIRQQYQKRESKSCPRGISPLRTAFCLRFSHFRQADDDVKVKLRKQLLLDIRLRVVRAEQEAVGQHHGGAPAFLQSVHDDAHEKVGGLGVGKVGGKRRWIARCTMLFFSCSAFMAWPPCFIVC